MLTIATINAQIHLAVCAFFRTFAGEMANETSNTTLKRQLKVLTIPVFIEMALVMLLGAVDTVMLSRYSDNSVAAVGLVFLDGCGHPLCAVYRGGTKKATGAGRGYGPRRQSAGRSDS